MKDNKVKYNEKLKGLLPVKYKLQSLDNYID